MVLEALAAVGLAGNIVQFVDFSSKLFTQTREIYSSAAGVTGDAADLITITNTLRSYCTALSNVSYPSPAPSTQKSIREAQQDVNLRKLVQSCLEVAERLLKALDKLAAKNPRSKWSSFRACLKAVWKKEEIEYMAKRIDSFRLELILQLEAIRDGKSSLIISSLDNLQRNSFTNNIDLTQQVAGLKTEILHSLEAVRKEFEHQGKQGAFQDQNSPRTTAASQDQSPVTNLLQTQVGVKKMMASIHIIRLLGFDGMDTRHKTIREAHPKTCYGAFSKIIAPWLVSESPLFWVSGKPGSGKSTLMKFLAAYSGTKQMLQNWAVGRDLVTASHFFWIGGTKLQKSKEGLLRSILCDILRKSPDLVEHVLPRRWERIYTFISDEVYGLVGSDVDSFPWTISELKDAFQFLITASMNKTCYCIFIDGLDEYGEDKDDLISVVQSLTSMPNMKLCVASRPWNVFESAFGNSAEQKLYLQDLNDEGIKLYIKENLEDLPDFRMLRTEEVRAPEITQEIVDNAQGVFLWVYLVVRDLKEGLRNLDSLALLQKRLRVFPRDLDDFFRHMFDSMDEIYRASAARAFQITLCRNEPLSVLNYWWIDIEESDPDFVTKLSSVPIHAEQLARRIPVVTRRLNGRLKGLLEITPSQDISRVDFLHRTVKDFLETKVIQELLAGWLPTDFNPFKVICNTTLAEMKSDPNLREHNNAMKSIFTEFSSATKSFEETAHQSSLPIWEKFDALITAIATESASSRRTSLSSIKMRPNSLYRGPTPFATFWTHAAACNVYLAVSDWFQANRNTLSEQDKGNLLLTAICDPQFPDKKMVNIILSLIEPFSLNDQQIMAIEGKYSRSSSWEENITSLTDVLLPVFEHGADLDSMQGPLASKLRLRRIARKQQKNLALQSPSKDQYILDSGTRKEEPDRPLILLLMLKEYIFQQPLFLLVTVAVGLYAIYSRGTAGGVAPFAGAGT